jgi:hypothetical protein
MPAEQQSPQIRSDGTSPPRETAQMILHLRQQIADLKTKIEELTARITALES